MTKLNANDIVFTKCEAYLPCGTIQNNQDNTHGMALYHSLYMYVNLNAKYVTAGDFSLLWSIGCKHPTLTRSPKQDLECMHRTWVTGQYFKTV